MRYNIIINLDYQNHNAQQLRDLFAEIRQAMQEAGFVLDGRRFTIDVPVVQAHSLARGVIEAVEQRHQARGGSIIPLIKEFFGFEPSNTINLLLPPTEEFHVEELANIEGLGVVNLFYPQ